MTLALQTSQGPLEVSDNPRVAVGGNAPPDPCAAFSLHLDDLEETARQYLDGKPIETEAQAEDVSRILSMARKAGLDADDARKAEKRPHDEAAKAVQERWKPILAKAGLIEETAKKVLAPYLQRQEDEQRAAAAAARQEAEEKAAVARTALESAGTNLAARAEAEALLKDAGAAERAAKRAEGTKAHATGGSRAIGLRTAYVGKITDEVQFARWVWANRKADMTAFLEEVAAKEARQGPRPIPGLLIEPQRKV